MLTYDVTLYQRDTTSSGTLTFLPAEDTSTAYTTGDFEATIDQSLTGTWYAYDWGTFSYWAASASGEANALSAIGWRTEGFIVGRGSLRPVDSPAGLWFFFRSLGTRFFLFGEAVVETPPPPAVVDEEEADPATDTAVQP